MEHNLRAADCYLRAVEPEDLQFIYRLENNPGLWDVGHTLTPYSKFAISDYLDNVHKDIYEVKQLRLGICTHDDILRGVVDLYDFNPYHKRAGVGIVIASFQDRKKGLATQALDLMKDFAFNHLRLAQLHACVPERNLPSRKLFEKCRFRESGTKKNWLLTDDGFQDEIIYQCFNEKL